jgi:hypothetical protein
VPFEYLIRLYTTISNPDYLTPRDQAALVAQLEVGLGEDGQHEAARNDIVTMLTKLRDREDATHRTRSEVEAILASRPAFSSSATRSPSSLKRAGARLSSCSVRRPRHPPGCGPSLCSGC